MMRQALYILAIVLISACGSRNRNKSANAISAGQEVSDALSAESAEDGDIEITVLESDDGNIRISGWEEPHSGTMGVYSSRIEYKWKGKTLTQGVIPNGAEESLMPMKLYTLGGGKYILYQYFREWSSQAYIEATALELTAEGLVPVKLFETEEGLADNINVEYNIPDWYFRAGSGEGYEWLYHFDKATKTLYHPSSPEYNHLSDRYIPYVWNGKTFSPGKEVANPFLHPSLSEYQSLVSLFRTERNLVRIDAMPDSTFRYEAWPKDATMLDKPELVIKGGTFNEDSSEWVFLNENFEYHSSGDELYILKSGAEIARWKKE